MIAPLLVGAAALTHETRDELHGALVSIGPSIAGGWRRIGRDPFRWKCNRDLFDRIEVRRVGTAKTAWRRIE